MTAKEELRMVELENALKIHLDHKEVTKCIHLGMVK